jgi:hypothetical protein
MSDGILKKTELLANIAIIAVALLLGGVLVKRYLLPGSDAVSTRNSDPRIPAGTKISLPDVDWAKNGHTLLLVLSRDCHFCTESAPFYQRLVRETAGREDVHLVAVLPQEEDEARKYLDSHEIAIGEVRHAPPRDVGAQVTPTLILVNETGTVQDSWIGKLEAPKEAEVLGRLLKERAAQ